MSEIVSRNRTDLFSSQPDKAKINESSTKNQDVTNETDQLTGQVSRSSMEELADQSATSSTVTDRTNQVIRNIPFSGKDSEEDPYDLDVVVKKRLDVHADGHVENTGRTLGNCSRACDTIRGHTCGGGSVCVNTCVCSLMGC